MAVAPRLNPTLFDKLLADFKPTDAGDERGAVERDDQALRFYTVNQLERFNETALRNTVRRELSWILNTTNFGAVEDLSAYPHVQTSVLNYGLPALTGSATTPAGVRARADQIRRAILAFEPRMSPRDLSVDVTPNPERENAVTYLIHGDVTSAVRNMPVQFKTDVEIETGAATVRE